MEIPAFVDLLNKHKANGFEIVAFKYENDKGPEDPEALDAVQKFVAEQQLPYPCSLISDKIRDQIPGFQSLPTTVVIDRAGTVRLILVGAHPHYVLEAVADRLMSER